MRASSESSGTRAQTRWIILSLGCRRGRDSRSAGSSLVWRTLLRFEKPTAASVRLARAPMATARRTARLATEFVRLLASGASPASSPLMSDCRGTCRRRATIAINVLSAPWKNRGDVLRSRHQVQLSASNCERQSEERPSPWSGRLRAIITPWCREPGDRGEGSRLADLPVESQGIERTTLPNWAPDSRRSCARAASASGNTLSTCTRARPAANELVGSLEVRRRAHRRAVDRELLPPQTVEPRRRAVPGGRAADDDAPVLRGRRERPLPRRLADGLDDDVCTTSVGCLLHRLDDVSVGMVHDDVGSERARPLELLVARGRRRRCERRARGRSRTPLARLRRRSPRSAPTRPLRSTPS